ncbi:hypothetical protein Tco_0744921 [Tanacetum coccineum]
MNRRKKHFAKLRAQEKKSKPPTKAHNRNTMSTYLKNMAGYKHNQLKIKSYDEIQEMFDKEIECILLILATGRLVNGLPCDRIDMIIEDLDLEPKIDAMVRDFLEKRRRRYFPDTVVKLGFLWVFKLDGYPDAVSMIQTTSHLSLDAVRIIQTASPESGLESFINLHTR